MPEYVPCKWGGRVKGHVENGLGLTGKGHVVKCMEGKNDPKYSKKKKKIRSKEFHKIQLKW